MKWPTFVPVFLNVEGDARTRPFVKEITLPTAVYVTLRRAADRANMPFGEWLKTKLMANVERDLKRNSMTC